MQVVVYDANVLYPLYPERCADPGRTRPTGAAEVDRSDPRRGVPQPAQEPLRSRIRAAGSLGRGGRASR